MTSPSCTTQQPRWMNAAAALALAAAATVCLTPQPTAAGALVVSLLLAPLLEEIVFRAGVQELLLRRALPPPLCTVATAALFALLHGLLRADSSALWVFFPALVLGAAYTRWRRLRVCVSLHAGMNMLWLCCAPTVARLVTR